MKEKYGTRRLSFASFIFRTAYFPCCGFVSLNLAYVGVVSLCPRLVGCHILYSTALTIKRGRDLPEKSRPAKPVFSLGSIG